jgi:hypothetical protein
MNLRHAAMLALVGWYLMVPPYNDNFVVNTHAPLSQWQVFQAYDDAFACNAVQAQGMKTASDKLKHREKHVHEYPPGTAYRDRFIAQQWQYLDSQCIASDDPRLKGK